MYFNKTARCGNGGYDDDDDDKNDDGDDDDDDHTDVDDGTDKERSWNKYDNSEIFKNT